MATTQREVPSGGQEIPSGGADSPGHSGLLMGLDITRTAPTEEEVAAYQAELEPLLTGVDALASGATAIRPAVEEASPLVELSDAAGAAGAEEVVVDPAGRAFASPPQADAGLVTSSVVGSPAAGVLPTGEGAEVITIEDSPSGDRWEAGEPSSGAPGLPRDAVQEAGERSAGC